MPESGVELKQLGGLWRTVRKGTSQLARNAETRTPVDGGGWTSRDVATGHRQVEHINNAVHRKHGKL